MADENNDNRFWSCGRYYDGANYVMTASKTTNSGSSWSRYLLMSTAGIALSIAIDPNNSNVVYIGGAPSFYKTTNAGTSWFNSTNGISDTIFDITIDPTNTNTIYAATPDGVFKTTNAGSNWTNTGCTGARAVLIDPDDNELIYAGTSSGVYQSTIGGGSWSAMSDGLNGAHITSLGINPGVYLFAGSEDAAMFRWSLQVGVDEQVKEGTSALRLSAYPNPMHNTAIIHYTLPNQTPVHLAIYGVQGRHIRTLVNDPQSAGTHQLQWNGTDKYNQPVAAGIYLYKLTTETETRIHKLILLK